jgi:hypothetical protein
VSFSSCVSARWLKSTLEISFLVLYASFAPTIITGKTHIGPLVLNKDLGF